MSVKAINFSFSIFSFTFFFGKVILRLAKAVC